MNIRIQSALKTWQAIPARDRFLLKGLAVFLSTALAYQLLWQPAHQRLTNAERHYQQQLTLARQVQSAQPQQAQTMTAQSLSSRVSASAAAAGLDLQQIEAEGEQLRLTISGEAQTLLMWLANLEREAGTLQMLTLEKRGSLLEARLVLATLY
jgi:general secretion pathway protein M